MYKIYLFVFDPYKTDTSLVHNIIKNNSYITNWWHYLASAYLLKSRYTLATIQDDIIRKWPNQHFLLIEVNTNNFGGWLPQAAWDWINNHSN